MFKYLKEEGFYSDLYDLSTVEECIRVSEYWNNRVISLKGGQVKIGKMGLDLQ